MIKAAIVILNWNGKNYLEKFLPSVSKYSDPNISRVIVADNGSSDDSIRWLELNYPQVEIIRLDKNYGFALGYIKALELVNTEYYVLLNSDVEVTDNWLEPLVKMMDEDHLIGACMPKIKSYSNKEFFEYAGAAGGFIDKYGYPFCRGRILSTIEKDNGQYDKAREVFWATGACMVIRKSAYIKAGKLDGDFFAHMEEIDLCWRMKKLGYKIVCNPSSEVFHVGGGTLPNNSPRKIYLNYRNSLYMLYKNLPSRGLVRIMLIRILLDIISSFMFLFTFRFTFFVQVIRAHCSFYKHLPILRMKRKEQNKAGSNRLTGHILNGSILLPYFLKKQKQFSALNYKNE